MSDRRSESSHDGLAGQGDDRTTHADSEKGDVVAAMPPIEFSSTTPTATRHNGTSNDATPNATDPTAQAYSQRSADMRPQPLPTIKILVSPSWPTGFLTGDSTLRYAFMVPSIIFRQ